MSPLFRCRCALIKREASRRDRTCQSKRSFGVQRKILTHPLPPPPSLSFSYPFSLSRAVADNFCERARKSLSEKVCLRTGHKGNTIRPDRPDTFERVTSARACWVSKVQDYIILAEDHLLKQCAAELIQRYQYPPMKSLKSVS